MYVSLSPGLPLVSDKNAVIFISVVLHEMCLFTSTAFKCFFLCLDISSFNMRHQFVFLPHLSFLRFAELLDTEKVRPLFLHIFFCPVIHFLLFVIPITCVQ